MIIIEKEQRHGKRLANPLKKKSYLYRQNCRPIEYTIDILSKSLSNKNSRPDSSNTTDPIPKKEEKNIDFQNTKRTQDS